MACNRFARVISILAVTLTMLSTAHNAHSQTKASKPNVLLIFVDDMGYGDLGCYGGMNIPTPNIDRLAHEGIRFTDGYVTASVCGPSRLGLLTGAYQQRLGCFWNDDLWQQFGLKIPRSQKLLPEALKAGGYRTGHIGKWNITPDATPYVDEAFAVMNWKGAYYPDSHGVYLGVDGPDFRMEPHGWGPPEENAPYLTDHLTNHALDFISHQKSEPFFLYLAYNAPHTPLQADKKYAQTFAGLEDEPNRLYAGMVSALDDNIGRVLDKLRDAGLEQNTLVAFASDNGPARGSSYLRGWQEDWPRQTLLGSAGRLHGHKAQRYEGGIRIPFILRWPERLQPGQVFGRPVSTLDFYPTFCAATGTAIPKATILDGVNLLPFVTGEKAGAPHEALFWKSHNGGAVRKGDWKLVIDARGQCQLFNLHDDLGETDDLAGKRPDRVQQLMYAYNQWSQEFPNSVSSEARAQQKKTQKQKREKAPPMKTTKRETVK